MRLRLLLAAAAGLLAATAAPAQPNPLYSNISLANFTGFASNNIGATGAKPITFLDLDDITVTAGGASQPVRSLTYSVANFAATAVNARVLLRFYSTNLAGDAPETLIGSVDITPRTYAASSGDLYTYSVADAAPAIFTVPSNGQFYAGLAFDNGGGATATAAELNDLGQLLISPPTTGLSANSYYSTDFTDPDDNQYTSSTVAPGQFYDFGGNPAANMAWQFSPVPEPTTVLGAAAVGLLAVRRLRRAVSPARV